MNTDEEYQTIFEHLMIRIIPFWLEAGLDRVGGGIFACFDPISGERVADHKFLWVQGRMLWFFSRFHRFLEGSSDVGRRSPDTERRVDPALLSRVREAAHSIYHFITRFGIEADNRVRFVVTREGTPATPRILGLDDSDDPRTSTYSDCFVLMGLAAYGREFDAPQATAVAQGMMERTIGDLRRGEFKTHPYPEPPGLEALGSRMILAMAAGELRPLADAETYILHTFQNLHERFLRPDGLFRELVPRVPATMRGTRGSADEHPVASALLQYANPGHTLETYGLLYDHADLAGRAGWNTKILEEGILETLRAAWDTNAGGLFSFIVPEISTGPGPDLELLFGSDDPLSGEPLFSTVRRDWSLKLWWPHVEGMYTTLALAMKTDSNALHEWYHRLRDYTFRIFPDPVGQEWLHIRDRTGKPLRRVVALPIKDPYHIARCLLKILLLLR